MIFLRRIALCLTMCALAAALLPEVWAYTSAAVRSSSSGAFRVVAAQPSGGTQPFVYCSATSIAMGRGESATVPVTCANGFNHSVTLAITYSATSAARVPSYSPASPLSLTVPGNSQATTTITVTTLNNTTRTDYILSFTATTSGSQAVDLSGLSFSSTVTVS